MHIISYKIHLIKLNKAIVGLFQAKWNLVKLVIEKVIDHFSQLVAVVSIMLFIWVGQLCGKYLEWNRSAWNSYRWKEYALKMSLPSIPATIPTMLTSSHATDVKPLCEWNFCVSTWLNNKSHWNNSICKVQEIEVWSQVLHGIEFHCRPRYTSVGSLHDTLRLIL